MATPRNCFSPLQLWFLFAFTMFGGLVLIDSLLSGGNLHRGVLLNDIAISIVSGLLFTIIWNRIHSRRQQN